ncbi:hypothetical protein RRG08_029697 [Elysia crispata]|uniref:BESS domain-containing protein n=1 Tax=Elysia crispata TaxID=231223 RepID=A0AAE1CTI7_9GAST|nr:hypothetical protein RRG08_029697 [Elysia crispata]
MNKSKERKSEEEDRNLLFLKSLLPHFTLIPQQHILRVRRRLETLVEELAYPQSTNGGSESNTFTYSSYQAYHDVPQYMPSSYQTSPQSSDNTEEVVVFTKVPSFSIYWVDMIMSHRLLNKT